MSPATFPGSSEWCYATVALLMTSLKGGKKMHEENHLQNRGGAKPRLMMTEAPNGTIKDLGPPGWVPRGAGWS
ncbi:hypothetical protein NDU88_006718 [Pleurodeles waltl]|uniref:Uncharacterized protein n=1 Tax=Pleurodeles waltl TaxID=8319 RepID=A0AAV7MDM3_PLEWA|nr:hypothetical protein NDU88_006718 [Pleurodeles waltl]